MKYFINGKFLSQPVTGVQRFALNLLVNLDKSLGENASFYSDIFILVVISKSSSTIDLPKLTRIQVKSVNVSSQLIFEQVYLPLISFNEVLINFTGSCPMFKRKQVCTIHDAAIFDVPYSYGKLYVLWYKILYKYLSNKVLRVITVSNFSKNRLLYHLSMDFNKIGVVYNAPDHFRAIKKESSLFSFYPFLKKKYFLSVGSLHPAKNISKLIEAFSDLKVSDFNLVVVGSYNNSIFAMNKKIENSGNIIFLGRVNDAELKELYTYAYSFIYPSLYEGFGLPPIEAMMCNCPVLASNSSSIPEICGDAVGYFDASSTESIKKVILRAMTDIIWLDSLRAYGRICVKKYTWVSSSVTFLNELKSIS